MRDHRPALIGRGWLWVTAAGVLALLLVAAANGQAQQRAGGAAAATTPVDRGKYLVNITGCHDCHSPKSQGMTPDPARLLSGRPSTTPMPSKADDEVHASLDLTAWYGPVGADGRVESDAGQSDRPAGQGLQRKDLPADDEDGKEAERSGRAAADAGRGLSEPDG